MHKSKNIRVLEEQTVFCSKTKKGEVTMLVGILLKYLFRLGLSHLAVKIINRGSNSNTL